MNNFKKYIDIVGGKTNIYNPYEKEIEQMENLISILSAKIKKYPSREYDEMFKKASDLLKYMKEKKDEVERVKRGK